MSALPSTAGALTCETFFFKKTSSQVLWRKWSVNRQLQNLVLECFGKHAWTRPTTKLRNWLGVWNDQKKISNFESQPTSIFFWIRFKTTLRLQPTVKNRRKEASCVMGFRILNSDLHRSMLGLLCCNAHTSCDGFDPKLGEPIHNCHI